MRTPDEIIKEWDAIHKRMKAQYEKSLAALNDDSPLTRERAHRLPRIGSLARISTRCIA